MVKVGSEQRATRWVQEALSDLEIAEILFKAGKFNGGAFYAQQAEEKSLKGLLLANHESPWGHSSIKITLIGLLV